MAHQHGKPTEGEHRLRLIFDYKYETAVDLPDDNPEKPLRMKDVGDAFLSMYQDLHEEVDLDSAIAKYEGAVKFTPDGHQCQAELLSQFGTALLLRVQYSKNIIDIENAISAFEGSLSHNPGGHADKLGCLSNLSNAFLSRFERSGDLVDIDKTISLRKEVLRLVPDGHADKAIYLANLGNSFFRRSEHSADLVDIAEAISAHERAVNLTADSHPNKPSYLSALGNPFAHRFKLLGDLVDIDKAISAHAQAVDLTRDGRAEKPGFLNNLANSFTYRFEHSGDLLDIDKAISAHKRAANLTPDGHASKPDVLNNLGNSLELRFERSEDLLDGNEAVSIHERAVHLTPDDHPYKPGHLSSLGNSFLCRFKHSKDLTDIDRAISAHERAVLLSPNGHIEEPAHLCNLGNSLIDRFGHSGELVDIDKAISALERAVYLTPDGHARKPDHLSHLGNAFNYRFRHSGDLVDSNTAISHYRGAAISSTGSPSARYHAALAWARLAFRTHIPSALQGYTIALNLQPQVAWLGKTISARHRELASMGDISSEAAAAAISAEQYETALEWLEQGRSIVWSQLHRLRTPVDALHDVEPSLANDLVRVCRDLERAGSSDTATRDYSVVSDPQLSMEQVAQDHRRLAEEWERLVKKARDIPGFEDFLQPKRFTQLCSAAKAGPVVVVNVHQRRCDALVVMAGLGEVLHIPLECFSYEKSEQLHKSLKQLLLTAGVRICDEDTRAMRRATITGSGSFQFILSHLWSSVVKPILDGLAFNVSGSLHFILHINEMTFSKVSTTGNPPRIWWCATGSLTFLPIHAAGIYNKDIVGFNVSDYVVSSYTPTLSTIINGTESHETRGKFRGLLAISQPNTPGQSALPNTTVELTQIQDRARNFDVHSLEGSTAMVESVVAGMETHSWIHLACHAVQDAVEPTKSAFCLHDGCLELSAILKKSLPHADFAFLSACQTATGDEKLSEEAVHLAAGLISAGYCGVIATMWSILDKDAPLIVGHVYSELFSDEEPDSTRAALALHHAVKCLRRQVGDSAFLSWVPFIHMGI